jgi:septal ring factor EnvC (AmiA/AmiB activator)
MPRILPIGAFLCVSLTSLSLAAQTSETRSEDTAKEMAALKRTVAEQDRRIATLERTMRSLQTTVLAAGRPLIPSSRTPEGWAAVKIGMSRAQVVDILGEPRTTDSVMDRQTLTYKDASDRDPLGTVVIIDDRVSEVASQRFRIHIPLEK